EYIEGETLEQRLKRRGALPAEEFGEIATQLLEAVGYAHARRVAHGDIAPSNIMLSTRDGRPNFVRLIDFGLASVLGSRDPAREGALSGTVAYTAPEQIRGEPVDARADVYALGALFYHMLSGTPPFTGGSAGAVLQKHLSETPSFLSEHLPRDHGVSRELVALIHECLAKSPEDRPASADELAEEMIEAMPGVRGRVRRRATLGDIATLEASAVGRHVAAASTSSWRVVPERDAPLGAAVTPVDSSSAFMTAYVSPAPRRRRRSWALALGTAVPVAVGALLAFALIDRGAASRQSEATELAEDGLERVAEAERLGERGEFEAAERVLDGLDPQVAALPDAAARIRAVRKRVEIDKLLRAGAELEQQGELTPALLVYDEVLELDSANLEARKRSARLRERAPAERADEPGGARVELRSRPSARVLVDGVDQGETPLTLEVAPGEHELSLVAEGRVTWTETLELAAGDNDAVERTLAPAEPSSTKPDKQQASTQAGKQASKKASKKAGKKADKSQESARPDEGGDAKPDKPFLPDEKKENGVFMPM
ncbi:MAG: serine/threonine protein kinase, partial [Myxococcales bacterium]|nr:serine/threonine protein kinase [Myxococcales bacterium]